MALFLSVLLTSAVAMSAADDSYNSLLSRLDALTASAKEPLFARHLKSVKAVTQAEWARAHLIAEKDPKQLEATEKMVEAMRLGFDADAGKWETYLNGTRSLILAYVSPYDQTVQWYALTLPKNWDPAKSYPMFVELHGAGDPHPLGWPAAQVGIYSPAKLNGYTAPKMYPMIARDGYHVFPFCRGNLGYRGVAERDVWDSLDDVEANFKIDPDRRYLYGFSMGGGGTWRLGARTPDRWAAVAIISGASSVRSGDGSGMNLANLPVWIWCGDKDFLFPRVKPMQDELANHGAEPIVKIAPGVDHAYLGEVQKECYDWMLTHRRKRPNPFRFAAMDDEHTSAWGITLFRREGQSTIPLPTYECRIDGQRVSLETDDAGGVAIDLAAMGMKGKSTVIWNGKTVYEGEPKVVEAGDVPKRR